MHAFQYAGPTVDAVLPVLFGALLSQGDDLDSRVGKTKELLHTNIKLKEPWRRELLLPHRRPNIAAQIAETMWVLGGRNDIEWLSNYLPRAADFSDDGKTWRGAYGPRLRAWQGRDTGHVVDQLAAVVELLRRDPNTRRAVAVIYDPALDFTESKDIPCNDLLNFSIRRGKLHLHVYVRSNDAMWGFSGINAFEWSALQEIVAGLVGVQVGSLNFSVTSFHLYERHWDRALKIQRSVAPPVFNDSPRFEGAVCGRDIENLDVLIESWFQCESEIRNGVEINVDEFPEPMLRSWLRVLQWWWTGDQKYIQPLEGTRLHQGCLRAVQPAAKAPVTTHAALASTGNGISPFLESTMKLHVEKHNTYGDSWKRRGEMLGIMANIARKIDRLGQNGAGETAADTALDLLVYLAKYRFWLVDHAQAPLPINNLLGSTAYSNTPGPANELMLAAEKAAELSEWAAPWHAPKLLEDKLTRDFETLEKRVTSKDPYRWQLVASMIADAYRLARQLWDAENSS